MAQRVPVAYENPRVPREMPGWLNYQTSVEAILKRMGAPDPASLVKADEQYLRASFRAALDAKTAEAVMFHKHVGGVVVAGELGAGCPAVALAPSSSWGDPAGPLVPVAACPPGAHAPPTPGASPCGPFTKVVRDEVKYAACRTRALELGSLTTPKAIYELVGPDLAHETQEVFVVLGFDVNMTLLCYDEVARGQVDHVAVAPGDVLGIVLLNRCKNFVVAHNHPSGDASPSKDDGVLTDKLKDAVRPFAGLVLRDHLVIGHGEVYSFAEKKLTKLGKGSGVR
jgi:DNA repair protein RadC